MHPGHCFFDGIASFCMMAGTTLWKKGNKNIEILRSRIKSSTKATVNIQVVFDGCSNEIHPVVSHNMKARDVCKA